MIAVETRKYVRSTGVVSRKIADETLVVPIRGGVGDLDSIFSFNPLGSDLWTLLEKEASLPEMAAWVVERYEVSEETATADIEAFLSELVQAGLVGTVSDAGDFPGQA
jgi:Coenzyme PQQ synthesis protein D (PqqD)